MLRHRAAFAALILFQCFSVALRADTAAFTIVNDPQLDSALAAARANFLALRAQNQPAFNRLDAVILVRDSNGTWRRGSFNGDTIAYPASCVKLAYMAAAMYWCRTNNYPYNYLDADVGPMIRVSDNYATGRVVDAITGMPNYQGKRTDPPYSIWYAARLYTENFLGARGLLENQTIMHKTYPTNSGSSPSGYEQDAINQRGGNRMQPKCSASLMLEIIKGAIEPGANAYMRDLLTHDRWSGDSEFGFGLPPGTIYENKVGVAYDTLEDIAYIVIHDVLDREYGWKVGLLQRDYVRWNGQEIEVDLLGQAHDPKHPDVTITIVGEVKFNLTKKEVKDFARKLKKLRTVLPGEIFPVCFCYRIRPEVRQLVRELGFHLVFSYGRLG
jgi:protein phosphatase methylesterase 1